MSGVRARAAVHVAAGVEVRRADAIFGVLAFAFEFLGLGRARPLLAKGIREHRWLTRLWVVSEDGAGVVHQELVFSIDWDRHEVYLSEGKGTVLVPDGAGLVAAVSPELTRVLRLFDEHRARNGLRTTYYVGHRGDAGEDVSAALGLGLAGKLLYAGDRIDVSVPTGELGELGGTYRRYGTG